jgi:hypothetical protein
MKITPEDMLEEILRNQFAILSALAAMAVVPGDERRQCRHRAAETEIWLGEHGIPMRQKQK